MRTREANRLERGAKVETRAFSGQWIDCTFLKIEADGLLLLQSQSHGYAICRQPDEVKLLEKTNV